MKYGLNSKVKLFILGIAIFFYSNAFSKTLYHYVLVGPNNALIIRTITDNNSCPLLTIDNKKTAMQMRVPLDTVEKKSQQSYFPVSVCELTLPSPHHKVSLNNQAIPLLKIKINKISVIGDTGCRLKAPHSFQACDNSNAWPLSTISHAISRDNPDVIIHVGDYLYRESQCKQKDCKNSPFGYNWNSWNEDVFKPMKELMSVSPLILIRGNHESCQRAGEGWFRFFDPYPYDPLLACIDRQQQVTDKPYSIILNSNIQIIVFDSAETTNKSIAVKTDLTHHFQDVGQMLIPSYRHWMLLHHPAFGMTYINKLGWVGGIRSTYDPLLAVGSSERFLSQFDLWIQGHIHTFELIDYQQSFMPLNIISGMGGTELEDKFPSIPKQFEVETDIFIKNINYSEHYGYLNLQVNHSKGTVTLKDTHGKTYNICNLDFNNKTFSCTQDKL